MRLRSVMSRLMPVRATVSPVASADLAAGMHHAHAAIGPHQAVLVIVRLAGFTAADDARASARSSGCSRSRKAL